MDQALDTSTENTEQPTLLDAIDAGVNEADGKEPEADAKADAEPAAPAAEAEKSAAVEGEKADIKADAEKPAEEKKPEAKAPDAVNDPIPEDVKGRTRERMESLVGKVKETTEKLTHVETQYNSVMGMIAATQATPEQYGMVLDYLGAVNSGDDTQVRGAIQVLQSELKALYEKLGEPMPGTDVLAAHQDLRDAVEVGDITEAHARELAAARGRAAAQTRREETQRTQTAAQAEHARAIDAGRNGLNALEVQLRASDPHYDAKRASLIEVLKPMMARVHPSQWVETFKEAYARVPNPVAVAPKVESPQPLRPRSPAGGQTKAASTLEEAVSMGIAAASQR